MTQGSQPCLIADGLSYEVDTGRTLFEQVSASVFAGDRIALVGKNGIGKSTLLKILSGQLSPTTGTVSRSVPVVYVPQSRQPKTVPEAAVEDQTVFDVLSNAADAWWEIEQLLQTTFQASLDLSSPASALSGGERMQLSLAIALWRSPGLLLLDEPTNHLDLRALENLRQALTQFKGALVIVSHKPHFLDRVVQTTWELTPFGLQAYGGNYSLYREQTAQMMMAKERSHQTARKELKRAKATAQQEQQRAARSNRQGRQKFLKGSIPPVLAGGMKRKAEKSAGNAKVKSDVAIASAAQRVQQTKMKSHKTTSIQLTARSQKKRTLIDIYEANLWVGDRELLKDVVLQVESDDRIAISGSNGSGKSSLIRAILEPSPTIRLEGGEKRIAEMKTVYLDQQYALVDRNQTILENMHRANPAVSYQLLRQQLGHFLFFNDAVHKQASVLSGGEMARCAIAMITISELDLLILDEPTNNLDIETVDQIVDGLNQYTGALIAISHDLDFLRHISLSDYFQCGHTVFDQANCIH